MQFGRPLFVLFTGLTAALAASARADIYILSNDGQVRGELVNTDEVLRKSLVIRTPEGAIISIDRKQVKQIVPQTAAELEFEKIQPTFADTVDDQWKLAEWCREHSLTRQRRAVMEHILELNPEHRQARLALGYKQVEGRWMQTDEQMAEMGFVKYKGKWTLPQEVEIAERKGRDDGAERQWFARIKQLRAQLDDAARSQQARESLESISDPFALSALAQALENERNRDVRLIYVRALGKIGPSAAKHLVDYSLNDADEEIRFAALDQLVGKPQPDAVAQYVLALKSKDNVIVNRAGRALGQLGDKSAIGPLIEALVTQHKFALVEGTGNPNGINVGFSNQGGGMTMGSKTTVVTRDLNNQKVLDALVTLTGGVNLNFDVKAWRSWYATQQKSYGDVRRD
jgi:HEAT repeats/PBS lyase HEAT-like repeat